MASSRFLGGLAAFCCLTTTLSAQWATQSWTINLGWNAVHLDVSPTDEQILLDDLFASQRVESIWMWNRRATEAEFLTDPEQPLIENPDWLVWMPQSFPQSATRTLNTLIPGRSYLIKSAEPRSFTIELTGRPVSTTPNWADRSYNLVAFQLNPDSIPTFTEYFRDVPGINPLSVKRFSIAGDWETVLPDSPMNSQVPYFVFSSTGSSFSGPLQVEELSRTGLQFNTTSVSRRFGLRNTTSEVATVKIRHIPSATPPSGQPVDAGYVPLLLAPRTIESIQDLGSYESLPLGESVEFTLAPGEYQPLQFALEITALPPAPVEEEYLYQSLLHLTDDHGFSTLIPVSATGIEGEEVAAAGGQLAAKRSAKDWQKTTASVNVVPAKQGLWVGEVRIDKVAQVAVDPNTPVPVKGDLRQRLILHADSTANTTRLLQQVVVLTKEADAAGPVTTPGATRKEIALITDDSLLNSSYSSFVARGNDGAGLRISSIAYPAFNVSNQPLNTLPGSGTFEDGTAGRADQLKFTYTLAYNDPLNPFVHQYHPDHDNLNAQFNTSTPLVSGQESFNLRHEVTLDFTATNPDPQSGGVTSPSWLGNQIGGRYTEKIYGVFRSDDTRKLNQSVYTRLGASAWYGFEEGSGTTFRESVSGKAHTLAAGATFVSAGRVGSATRWTGAPTVVPNSDFPDLPIGNSPYTISVWIKPQTLSGDQFIVSWGLVTTNLWNGMLLRNANAYVFWFANDSFFPYGRPAGEWAHFCTSFDGTTRKIFINGALIGQDTPVGKNTASGGLKIGGDGYRGDLDELAFFKRALSQSEITELASMGSASNSNVLETPITVSGYFSLSRFSTSGTLNPPSAKQLIPATSKQSSETTAALSTETNP